MSRRAVPAARAVPTSQSRPMSADDIQKAKTRAMYMQDKYGKAEKTEEPRAAASSEVIKRPTKVNKIETPTDPQRNSTSQEHTLEKLKKDQLQWRQSSPGVRAEVRMSTSRRVGAGESSKQVRVQTQRSGREKEEAFYSNPKVIPPNPKEPWDVDDSLTTEIPLVRKAAAAAAPAPASDDADNGPPPSASRDNGRAAAAGDSTASTSAAAAATGSGLPEPDLELLAALLKNPEIVHALTSGRGQNLTDGQKVALLDLVKRNGVGLAGTANGLASATKEVSVSEPISLPSPTPSASATRVGWRSEFLSHAQSTQLQHLTSHALPPPPPPPPPPTIYTDANQTAFNHHQARSLLVPPRAPTTVLSLPQQLPAPAHPWPPQQHRLPAPNLHPTTTTAATTAFSYGHAPSWQARNPPPDHYQPLPPPTMKPQPRALPEAASYPPKAPAWPPSAGAASAGGQNPVLPVSRTGYPNGFINGNGNNMYPRGEAWGARSRQLSDVWYDRPQAEWSRQGYSRHDIEKGWWNRDPDRDGNRRW